LKPRNNHRSFQKISLTNTPVESVHALGLEKLRTPAITFWTAWIESELCGCGALQTLEFKNRFIR
jgi:putative acetyltransferase